MSFDLGPGTVTALVGPNGAGKTTLLRCLAGLEQPLAGTVTIDGIDVASDPRLAHRKLGFLQDFFGVYETLSVARNLLHAAAAQGIQRGDLARAATEAAAAVGLTDRLDQRAGELSRGLRQRLAIARTIVHAPALLLLDEPASGLDPEARSELSALILRLGAGGMTIIVSSHILAELEEYSTQLLAMRGGKIGPLRIIGTQPGAARRLRLGLIGDPESAVALLATLDHVANPRVEPGAVSFDFTGDPAAQAALLRALIGAGLAVVSLAEVTINLQHIYAAEAAA